MLFNKLSPTLITYNRAALLQKTLETFMNARLNDMLLTVLDNASTDDTSATVSRCQSLWPNLTYHRNRYNIGGNANILRAIELSDTDYHWVIGDDDAWNFNPATLQELSEVLEKGEADIIRLGWLVSDSSRGKLMDARELAHTEKLFFSSLSMISATLIRRTLFARYLPLAYQNIGNSYPQLVPLLRATEEIPLKVYTLTHDLMTHTPSKIPGYFHGDLEWYAGWYRTSRYLSTPFLKKKFVSEATRAACRHCPGALREFARVTALMLYFKSFGLNQWPWLVDMLNTGTGWRLRTLGMMVINLVTPEKLLALTRKAFFMLSGKPQKTLRVDRSRL